MYTAGDNKSRKSNYIKLSKSKNHIRHSFVTMSLQYLQIFSIGTLLNSSDKLPQSGILCLILALDVNWHSSKTWTSDWMLPHAQRRSSGGMRDHLPVSNFRWWELNRIRLKATLSCSLRLEVEYAGWTFSSGLIVLYAVLRVLMEFSTLCMISSRYWLGPLWLDISFCNMRPAGHRVRIASLMMDCR